MSLVTPVLLWQVKHVSSETCCVKLITSSGFLNSFGSSHKVSKLFSKFSRKTRKLKCFWSWILRPSRTWDDSSIRRTLCAAIGHQMEERASYGPVFCTRIWLINPVIHKSFDRSWKAPAAQYALETCDHHLGIYSHVSGERVSGRPWTHTVRRNVFPMAASGQWHADPHMLTLRIALPWQHLCVGSPAAPGSSTQGVDVVCAELGAQGRFEASSFLFPHCPATVSSALSPWEIYCRRAAAPAGPLLKRCRGEKAVVLISPTWQIHRLQVGRYSAPQISVGFMRKYNVTAECI